MLLGIEDYEQRSNSGRCSSNHPMEIGRLNPVRGTTEIARDPKASQRKQSWIAGSIEDQINRPVKIPAYYDNSPPYTTLKKKDAIYNIAQSSKSLLHQWGVYGSNFGNFSI